MGGLAANGIAKWDGSSWTALGEGISGSFASVISLAVFDDGTGEALYVGGSFFFAGGEVVRNIARWDGSDWLALGTGMEQTGGFQPWVQALAVFDDGGGPALYAGGGFTIAGGVPASRIAKWDGTSWSPLGTGMSVPSGSPAVFSLAVFDDGTGPALYAGGEFTTAGGVPVDRIARWDGTNWSELGGGIPGFQKSVRALAVFDDGSGDALYAGGHFTTAGEVAANHVAKWDGTTWSAMGGGVGGGISGIIPLVDCLLVFQDGNGPALYAGGDFTIADGLPAKGIAKWDGVSWSALDHGVSESVLALTILDVGEGPSLFVAGKFGNAFDSHDSYLAQWGGCVRLPDPWTDLGFALGGFFQLPKLIGAGDLAPSTPGSLLLTNAFPGRPAVLFASVGSTPLPLKCGTLVPTPALLQLPLVTDAFGQIPLAWSSWPAGLSGLSLYFQYAIQDATAVCGVALSNALRADVP